MFFFIINFLREKINEEFFNHKTKLIKQELYKQTMPF